MLETIIDTHSTLAGYPRQFLMSFRDGIKYNFMPVEHSWEPYEHYSLVSDFLKPTEAAKMQQNTHHLTKISRRCPYNFVWDRRVAPAEVCYRGEFAGYIDLEPRIPLKRFINFYSKSGKLYNLNKLEDPGKTGGGRPNHFYFTDLPQISQKSRPTVQAADADFNWEAWLQVLPTARQRKTLQSNIYERFVAYCRIIPSDFAMEVPAPNSPQIWKFILINGGHLLFAEKIYSAVDALPILIGQPLEDGFELQTQSIAEAQIPFQDAISTLVNIRFNSARRAVSDRALFDATLINEADINTPTPAPKIPVRLSGLNDKTLKDAYQQIPYDARGTDGVITDIRSMFDLSDRMSGLNNAQQGRFQKGNKSVQEWQDTMNMADNRPRLPALMTEFQVMGPIKQQIKLNIFQHGVIGSFQNFTNGTVYKVTQEQMTKLKEKVMSLRVADGFTPKSKLASTEFLGKLLETVAQVPQLAQTVGAMLPQMFVHLAQLGGVRGLEQYLPKQPVQGAPGGTGSGTNTQGTAKT